MIISRMEPSKKRGSTGSARPSSSARPPRTCFYCNEVGHIKANCPKNRQASLQGMKCFRCGEPGHLQRNCPLQQHTPPSDHSGSRARNEGQRLSGTASSATVHNPWSTSGKTNLETAQHSISLDSNDSPYKAQELKSSPKRAEYPAFIDTHCHLEYVFSRYRHQGSFDGFMKSQKYPDNFGGCISTFCDPAAFSSFGMWQDLLKELNVWGTFGIHPHNAKYYYNSGPELEDRILKCIEHPKCVAYGEIGLDYAEHSPSDQQTQREALIRQLQVAIPFSKPFLFHCRDAEEELLHIASEYVPREWKIHLHCYTGPESTALRFADTFPNLYFGVCGNVTYHKNSALRQTVTDLPLERLIIETDAPYNTPSNVPRGGRFSHPAHAFYVAKEIAHLKKANLSEVLTSVRENTKSLYGI